MTEPTPAEPKAGGLTRSEKLESVVDDVFGVDFKLPRTLRDLVIRPNRVANAVLAHDRKAYTSQVKLFLALFAVQTFLMGWGAIADSITLSALFQSQPDAHAIAQARLAASGSGLAEADAAMSWAMSWGLWPVTAVSSFLYVLVIWMMRRRIGWYAALMLYLVITNAAYVLTLPLLLAGRLFGVEMMMAASGISLLLFYIYAAIVLYRRTADTILELSLELIAFIVTTIPVVIAMTATMFVALEVAMRIRTGHSLFGIIISASSQAAAAAQ